MHTGLSPEWDRGFDAAFTDLVSHDDDLVHAEFNGLIQASWPAPPAPESWPAPPAPGSWPALPLPGRRRPDAGPEDLGS